MDSNAPAPKKYPRRKTKIIPVQNDIVFSNFFSDRHHAYLLYKALHPEDTETKEDDITIEASYGIHSTYYPYSFLGFSAKDKLLILAEAESTWSVNIVPWLLCYLCETVNNYLHRTKQSVYGRKEITVPRPECVVIYTGDQKDVPEYVTLAEDFYGDKDIPLNLKVKVITDGQPGDIINQYITFKKGVHE